MRRVPSPLPFGLQSEKAQKKQQFSGQFKTYVLFTLLVLIFWFLTTKILSLPLSCPETNKIHLKPKSIEDAISNRQQTQGWPDSQRVAWIVPYLSAPYLPKYAAFCFRTIATASPFLHFFLFYENASMILPEIQAENLHFIHVKQGTIIQRLLQELKRGFGDNVTNTVQQNLKEMLEDHPRQLTVYRPLYASAFEDYISNYSHWAWGDIDTLLGDIVHLVSGKDLRTFDIISFTRGVGHIYLQGQLTILVNRPCVKDAWRNAHKVESLLTSTPEYAWEEIYFSEWALYESHLYIKIMPLHLTGNLPEEWSPYGLKEGNRSDVIWEDGRLLNHSPFKIEIELPQEKSIQKPLIYQPTWTDKPQQPGLWILERFGSNEKSVWHHTKRTARGYDERTQEFVIFHFSYEHENRVHNALSEKDSGIISALSKKPRIAFQYDPFDFVEPPPCGHLGGGHCPHSS